MIIESISRLQIAQQKMDLEYLEKCMNASKINKSKIFLLPKSFYCCISLLAWRGASTKYLHKQNRGNINIILQRMLFKVQFISFYNCNYIST